MNQRFDEFYNYSCIQLFTCFTKERDEAQADGHKERTEVELKIEIEEGGLTELLSAQLNSRLISVTIKKTIYSSMRIFTCPR